MKHPNLQLSILIQSIIANRVNQRVQNAPIKSVETWKPMAFAFQLYDVWLLTVFLYRI